MTEQTVPIDFCILQTYCPHGTAKNGHASHDGKEPVLHDMSTLQKTYEESV
ncbi:hypothetical protein [Nitrosopumilus sp.]|uniref:hypothetical protein n=1 Tax=Nitrosopumilus sp. TaxID=2024843 RepID=UPI002931BC85|nr:hypothetical protein [Nitrosopumilus sp.]